MQVFRTRSWLIVFAVVFGAVANARAQEQPEHEQIFQPFGPVDLGDIKDMQLFAPVDSGDMDGFPKGAVGPFFKYERIYWSSHQPSFGLIGSTDPTLVALGLSNNTNQFITSGFVWGNRFEIGYRQCDNSGWVTSIVKSNTQYSSTSDIQDPTDVGFNDPTAVLPLNDQIVEANLTELAALPPPPIPLAAPVPANSFIRYQPLVLQNSNRWVGVDLLKSIRFEPEQHGGIWELFFGPRYFQFHDRFSVSGTAQAFASSLLIPGLYELNAGPPPVIVGLRSDLIAPAAPNFWDLGIDNNIVGPELGVNWSLEREHWTISTDFRALIGANFQNEHLSGALSQGYSKTIHRIDTGAQIGGITQIGTNGLALFNFNSANHNVTFAPLGEARFDATYKVTKNVSLEAGYTAILVTGISRASDRIVYNVPNMSILSNGADKQHVFINGVNFGFNVNY